MDYEKLGKFYLGRPHDLSSGTTAEEPLLYDSKDLTTHAVCVGMTGSGKTGLCVGLLEEAAIDGIPSIVIDPKGDLGNLLLTFPSLRPEDFAPWINEDDARKKGVSAAEYAAAQAELWKKGLAAWGQDGARIQRLHDAADFAVYTPGSSAGIPISILDSFAAPPAAVRDDAELLGDRIATTVTSLLGFVGIRGDAVQSREHILLATILDHEWRQGRDLDLAALIQAVQSPPVAKIGVIDLDAFYPAGDRFGLAMSLNNLLAAPGFSAWLEGEPLDIQNILYTAAGKPRVAIFSIAHLDDSERMFFVSLLLNQVLGWTRSQPGTNSLRALLYMDEIFGYMPPVAEPPSKKPLLTMLKQARAHGVGVVLATQNPVDLDYKGLSNAGTWFIGRLQTERDKMRVLDGLEGAAAGAGRFDRGAMEETLAGLGQRRFLLNNVHEDAPVIFETRWAMSYLRGPMTREQIRQVMAGRKPEAAPATPAAPAPAATPAAAAPAARATSRPVLPPAIPQYFVPARDLPLGAPVEYVPQLLAAGVVHFVDRKHEIDTSEPVTVLAPLADGVVPVDWERVEECSVELDRLETAPAPAAAFAALPGPAAQEKSYAQWKKDFDEWLYRGRKLELFESPAFGRVSEPGESERDFRVRLQHLTREQRDAKLDELRGKFRAKVDSLEERLRKAEQKREKEAQQSKQVKLDTALRIGSTLLGAVLGRSTRASSGTAMRSVTRSWRDAQDVARAEEDIEEIKKDLAELQAEAEREVAELAQRLDPLNEELAKTEVRPRRTDIEVRLLGLAWVPRRG
ncbi:MAG: ATP-binding protein [Acidobacteriota bacterium]|nr:ATP-binding protein [Acidobacteriota bacterium]